MSWPQTVTLAPTITDDAWGGALAYVWTQVSGPATATIASPETPTTDVSLPEVAGVYRFSLTVSRAHDDLIGSLLVRVVAVTSASLPDEPGALGVTTVTANGVASTGLDNSVSITKTTGQPSSCTFDMYGARIAVGNEVVLERDGIRLFAGICLELGITAELDGTLILTHPTCAGYAWHLTRRRVTKVYDAPIADIVADLVGMAPGGLTVAEVEDDLPSIHITFSNAQLDAALTTTTKRVRGLTWTVDDDKGLHVVRVPTAGDPAALTPGHRSLRDVSITQSISQVANRVFVFYGPTVIAASVIGEVLEGATEIQVENFTGYSPTGGTFILNGNTVSYTGLDRRNLRSVYGLIAYAYTVATAIATGSGDLPVAYEVRYWISLQTPFGETPLVQHFGFVAGSRDASLTSISVSVLTPMIPLLVGGLPDTATAARVTGIHLYRESGEPGGDGAASVFRVGSLPAGGGQFVDAVAKTHLGPTIRPQGIVPPGPLGNYPWDEPPTYFLTGVSGVGPPGDGTNRAQLFVVVEDTAAQGDLAGRLGGGDDDGVVETSIDGGPLTRDDALALGVDYLATVVDLQTRIAGNVRDPLMAPGQYVDVVFPAPIDVTASVKIQEVHVTGFETGIPHVYEFTAETERVSLDELLLAYGKPTA